MFWNKKKSSEIDIKNILGLHEILQFHKAAIDDNNEKTSSLATSINKTDSKLRKRIQKLERVVEELCPCKDVTSNDDDSHLKRSLEGLGNPHFNTDTGMYDLMGKTYSIFNKTCTLCGKVEYITRKEYLTHQKETIESSLKECE